MCNQFHSNKNFNRGNAAFIGCSILVRPAKTSAGTRINLACIYATLNSKFYSIEQNYNATHCCSSCPQSVSQNRPCQLNYVKNISPYPELCTCQ